MKMSPNEIRQAHRIARNLKAMEGILFEAIETAQAAAQNPDGGRPWLDLLRKFDNVEEYLTICRDLSDAAIEHHLTLEGE